jgi:hypothetical protein
MTADTATATMPSPWPLAEATLASLPSSRYLWNLSLTTRAATEVELEKYEARKVREDWQWLYGADAGILPVPPAVLVGPPVKFAAPAAAPVPAGFEPVPVPEPPALPSPAVPQLALNPVAEMAMQRFQEAHDAQDAAEAARPEPSGEPDTGPEGTQVIAAVSAETEAIPVVTAEGEQK